MKNLYTVLANDIVETIIRDTSTLDVIFSIDDYIKDYSSNIKELIQDNIYELREAISQHVDVLEMHIVENRIFDISLNPIRVLSPMENIINELTDYVLPANEIKRISARVREEKSYIDLIENVLSYCNGESKEIHLNVFSMIEERHKQFFCELLSAEILNMPYSGLSNSEREIIALVFEKYLKNDVITSLLNKDIKEQYLEVKQKKQKEKNKEEMEYFR